MKIRHSGIIETSGVDYPVFRIPGIVVTKAGTVIVCCECRQGGDWSVIDIGMRRSTDHGRTWETRKILRSGRNINTTNNPVMFVDGDVVHVIYFENYKRIFYRCSTDDGVTWSAEAEISAAAEAFRAAYPWTVLAAGPGHGTALTNGRLIVPVWLASDPTNIFAHAPSVCTTLCSDDRGKSWQAGQLIAPDFAPSMSEACLAELPDGTVTVNIRNCSDRHERIIAMSKTGEGAWYDLRFDRALPDPQCMAGMCAYPEGVLFTNCNSRTARQNLTLRKSTGGMAYQESLPYSKSGGYSDVFYSARAGTAMLAYETDECRHLRFAEISL